MMPTIKQFNKLTSRVFKLVKSYNCKAQMCHNANIYKVIKLTLNNGYTIWFRLTRYNFIAEIIRDNLITDVYKFADTHIIWYFKDIHKWFADVKSQLDFYRGLDIL